MLGRGVKRKRSAREEESVAAGKDAAEEQPYLQERQQVLSMCLDKLQWCRSRVEPSLRRAVLLANTLRQIQDQMRQEGWEPPSALATLPTSPATPLHTPTLPPMPSDCLLGAGCGVDIGASLCPPLTMLREGGGAQGERGAPACPGCTESEGQNTSSSSPSSSSSSFCSAPEDSRAPDLLFSSFEIANSTSYLTDLAFDDIFEDIDTSMYDCSDFSSVLAHPQPRLNGATPVSEESLKSFSSRNTSSALQLCLTDLNDLDHIMEILVGS